MSSPTARDERPARTRVRLVAQHVDDIPATHVALAVWPATADGAADASATPLAAESTDTPEGPTIDLGGAEAISRLDVDLFAALEQEQARGKAGEVVVVPLGAAGRGAGSPDGNTDLQTIYLVGLGDGSVTAHRRAGAALARAARGVDQVVSTATSASTEAGIQAFVEGALLATFAYRVSTAAKAPLGELVLADTGAETGPVADAATRGEQIGAATWLARTLVHTPANIKDPQWLAAQAEEISDAGRLRCRIRDEQELAAEGFGGLLGVGQGSPRPPRLIELIYTPEEVTDSTPHVVLVGKGITYDTGGISLKPPTAMVPMKTDMSGGAVVIGVLSALAGLGVDVRVTGLVAAAENMPGGGAQRPGDVLTQYDGTTVEVLNTDAEGRLVLADAMAYAVAERHPTVLIDVATLTGAATLGLGRRHAALFSPQDDLAEALRAAGEDAGEHLWRLPLVEDYRDTLDSEVADLAHVPPPGVSGGAITAALFLQRFSGGLPWAHLDIAGPGRADADEHEVVKGGTAFGTRALLYWLAAGAPLK